MFLTEAYADMITLIRKIGNLTIIFVLTASASVKLWISGERKQRFSTLPTGFEIVRVNSSNCCRKGCKYIISGFTALMRQTATVGYVQVASRFPAA